MKRTWKILSTLLVVTTVLSACGTPASTKDGKAPKEEQTRSAAGGYDVEETWRKVPYESNLYLE